MADKPAVTPVVEEEKAVVDVGAEVVETEKAPVPRKKKNRRSVPIGQIHVLATFNNTIVTVTDPKGAVLTTASAGSSGFRGSKKGTAYAAQVASEKAISGAKRDYGLEKADVFIKGIGMGRDAVVRTMIGQRVAVESLYDVTGMPHGGVRPRKARRT
jgi:small subunit ribosomal protein S11